jgi:hypothetical protein
LILFFVTFALPTCAARTEKVSNQLKRLTVEGADSVAGKSGIVLLSGTLNAAGQLVPPHATTQGVIAYHYRTADYETRLETRKETRTEVRGGKDVQITEDVTEEVTDWVEKTNEKRFSSGWNIDGFEIDPNRAVLDLPWELVFSEDDGKHRESVEVIASGINVLLAVDLDSGRVSEKPKIYRLTTKTQEQLVTQLHGSEEASRWGLLILSVVLWTLSLNLIIGPALILINIFPIQVIGAAVRTVITIVSFTTACILAASVYALVKYWWLIALLMAALAVVVFISSQKKGSATSEEVTTDDI